MEKAKGTFNEVTLSRILGLAYHNRGYTYESTGRYEKAKEDFEKAIHRFQMSDDPINLVYTLRNKSYAHAIGTTL
jgi:tetratricopeptide (TPR) repeat protein